MLAVHRMTVGGQFLSGLCFSAMPSERKFVRKKADRLVRYVSSFLLTF
jgi:hypothetical protein